MPTHDHHPLFDLNPSRPKTPFISPCICSPGPNNLHGLPPHTALAEQPNHKNDQTTTRNPSRKDEFICNQIEPSPSPYPAIPISHCTCKPPLTSSAAAQQKPVRLKKTGFSPDSGPTPESNPTSPGSGSDALPFLQAFLVFDFFSTHSSCIRVRARAVPRLSPRGCSIASVGSVDQFDMRPICAPTRRPGGSPSMPLPSPTVLLLSLWKSSNLFCVWWQYACAQTLALGQIISRHAHEPTTVNNVQFPFKTRTRDTPMKFLLLFSGSPIRA